MTYDADTNFDYMKFCAEVKIFGIICQQIPIKAHWSIEKVEKYYASICQVYNIIQAETKSIISKNAMLQIIFKAVNDTADLDGLVLTLLVFGTYPCIVTNSLPSTFQQQRANAMTKAMSKLYKLKV